MTKTEFEHYFRQFHRNKKIFDSELSSYLKNSRKGVDDLIELNKIASTLFSSFEVAINEISTTDKVIQIAYIEDLVDSAVNISNTIIGYWKMVFSESLRLGITISPSKRSYATIQRLIKTYRKEEVQELFEGFNELHLPVSGFHGRRKHKLNKGKIKKGQIAIGLIGILVGGLLSYLTETNTGMRLLFLRVLIGVSIGLLMSGFLENQIKVSIKFKGVIITALGAAAYFLIVYFFNPAPIPTL